MVGRRLSRWQTFGRRWARAWKQFQLEWDYQSHYPDRDTSGEPPTDKPPFIPPGEPPSRSTPTDYDDLERRAYQRLKSWALGNSVEHTDMWLDDANWARVQANIAEMHEIDLRSIISMSREEFRAAASRYEPFWYH